MKTVFSIGILLLQSICVSAQLAPLSAWGSSMEDIKSNEYGEYRLTSNTTVVINTEINKKVFTKTYYFDKNGGFYQLHIKPISGFASARNALLTFIDVHKVLVKEMGPYDNFKTPHDFINMDPDAMQAKDANYIMRSASSNGITMSWENDSTMTYIKLNRKSENYIMTINVIQKSNVQNPNDYTPENASNSEIMSNYESDLIKAGRTYNAAITFSLVGVAFSTVAIANDNQDLAYLSIGASFVSVILYYVGNQHLINAGFNKNSKLSLSTAQGVGLAYKF